MPLFRDKRAERQAVSIGRRLSGVHLEHVLLACCVAGLFCPTQLALVGLGSLTQPLTLLGFLGGICYILLNVKRVTIDAPVFLTTAFVVISLAVTWVSGQFTTLFLQTLFSEAMLCLVVQIALRRDSIIFVKLSFCIIGLYVVANLVFILANISTYPDGFYRSSDPDAMAGVWLLGHKNQLRNYPLDCSFVFMGHCIWTDCNGTHVGGYGSRNPVRVLFRFRNDFHCASCSRNNSICSYVAEAI